MPVAANMAEPLAVADFAKATRAVQPPAGTVRRDDLGLQRPVTGRLAERDQSFDQSGANAAATD